MSQKKTAPKAPIKDILKEKDVFLTTSERIYEYFLRNTKKLIVIGVVIVLSIFGVTFYNSYQQSAELKASAAYEKAWEAAANLEQAEAIIAMEEIINQHPGRKAARMASFTLISLYINDRNFEKAT
ncbi:MAG: tetratricopeptide repeat protein, partial [Candidatus Adiutrix sp.]